jgi:hypothetical protein
VRRKKKKIEEDKLSKCREMGEWRRRRGMVPVLEGEEGKEKRSFQIY